MSILPNGSSTSKEKISDITFHYEILSFLMCTYPLKKRWLIKEKVYYDKMYHIAS